MKKALAFVIVLLFELSLSLSAKAEDARKSEIQTKQFQTYPWSEDSEYVRVTKSILSELAIPSVTITNHEAMQFILTDEFIKTFKLTPSEVQQVSRGISDALHQYRTVEGKHFEPADEPAKIGRGRQPWAEADERFNFRLVPFPEEAAAIRKRLEQVVASSLGEERSKFFWENGSLLDSEINTFTKSTPLPPGTTSTTTYTFVLPTSNPGRVDRYRTTYTEHRGGRGGGSDGRTYGEALDQYAPETLKPVLARWRKSAANGTPKSESPSAVQALPSAQVKESVATKVDAVNSTGSLKGEISISALQTASRWDDTVPFCDFPKSLIKSLQVSGLTPDEELSPEAAALFGLTEGDQKTVSDLYSEMKTRFEKLERAHFERTQPGRNSFVLKAFPEESAALKREWAEKLKRLVGQTRGEMLDQSIRTGITPFHLMKRDAKAEAMRRDSRRLFDSGPTWLHRGTAETRLDVTTGVDGNGRPTLSIDYHTEGGGRGSGGVPGGQVPERWRHLLTPDMLGLPLTL